MIARLKRGLRRATAKAGGRRTFRQRYEEAEARRAAMLERLRELNDEARSHPAHKRVRILLNERFRQAKVAQRIGILQSAEWLIDVLETLTLIA
jgi:hypothetical protein